MSRLRLGKKLQPAKKSWKSFSNTMKSRFHKLNIPKNIKKTLQILLATFQTLSHIIASRFQTSLTSKTKRPYNYAYSSSYYLKNMPAIHIDDLFAESSSSSSVHVRDHAQGETSKGKEVMVVDSEKDSLPSGNGGEMDTIEDAWKAVVAKSPLLRVDERAEEFISKFREDMRIQKERSLLEFQEMLARSC